MAKNVGAGFRNWHQTATNKRMAVALRSTQILLRFTSQNFAMRQPEDADLGQEDADLGQEDADLGKEDTDITRVDGDITLESERSHPIQNMKKPKMPPSALPPS